MGFGATVAISVTIFVLSVITIFICFTCSYCCLYKMCLQPRCHHHHIHHCGARPLHSVSKCAAQLPLTKLQGLPPHSPQPGMPAAPYPMKYPPLYLAQPMGLPVYHETLAGGAAMSYPASQPPYNPAYINAPKVTKCGLPHQDSTAFSEYDAGVSWFWQHNQLLLDAM
ncbi:LOW QUALITY PROTEIN: Protein shisa-5, partial [Plecturocebus cupreus]